MKNNENHRKLKEINGKTYENQRKAKKFNENLRGPLINPQDSPQTVVTCEDRRGCVTLVQSDAQCFLFVGGGATATATAAWLGLARLGKAWLGKARLGTAWLGKARLFKDFQGFSKIFEDFQGFSMTQNHPFP